MHHIPLKIVYLGIILHTPNNFTVRCGDATLCDESRPCPMSKGLEGQ